MRRGEAHKRLREHGSWMRLSERAVFHALLERSDNADCSIPAYMTPSLDQLAEAVCCAKSTAVLALDHLEVHGWVERKRVPKPGSGHKTTYQLHHGWVCTEDCKWAQTRTQAKSKGSDSRTLSSEKGSDSRTEKGSDSHPRTPRSAPVSDEGLRGGEGKEDDPVAAALKVITAVLPVAEVWTQWPAGSIGEAAQ